MMNTIRLAGDMCHVMSILVLLLRLRISKNAIGVSIKTQELYLIVFVTRYLDLFTTYYSLYNSFMKILYISATAYIIYMVKGTERFKSTYDKAHDSFLHYQFAVAPCVIFAVITNVIMGFNIMEVSLNSMSGKGFGDSLEVVKFYQTVLSQLFNFQNSCPHQLLWTFSIYLEAAAIVPQLIVLQRYREVENLTGEIYFILLVLSTLTTSNDRHIDFFN